MLRAVLVNKDATFKNYFKTTRTMIGEKVIIGEDFKRLAQELSERLIPLIQEHPGRFVLSISGESGSGKTSISFALANQLTEEGIKAVVIQQDDYSALPPQQTVLKRRKSLVRVGFSEVQLALLEKNLQEIKEGKEEIEKPLVVLDKNQIVREVVSLKEVKVVIVEGIYSFILDNVDKYLFINRQFWETAEARKLRGRDEQDELMERVLQIEHGLVLLGKPKADFFITKNFEILENPKKKKRTRGDFQN